MAAMQSLTQLGELQAALAKHRLVRAGLCGRVQACRRHRLCRRRSPEASPVDPPCLPSPSPPVHTQAVIHFWAAWCEPCAVLDTVLAALAADAPAVAALRVEAEEAADISGALIIEGEGGQHCPEQGTAAVWQSVDQASARPMRLLDGHHSQPPPPRVPACLLPLSTLRRALQRGRRALLPVLQRRTASGQPGGR